ASECNGEWKLMKLVIPATKTESMIESSKEYYARAWVGNKGDFENSDGVEAYIDDVRFYPAGALVVSTFYDQKWREPILTIDENNNPGHLVVFDQFGRKIKRYKVDKNNPDNNKLLTSNEYFMMGQN
ncbi:MAG TPA: hypothetical protein VHO70_17615, partial [Chitinispirillaceae bacterium]|nr:hypothetical protein [Chitinispirillaceae bacterium]